MQRCSDARYWLAGIAGCWCVLDGPLGRLHHLHPRFAHNSSFTLFLSPPTLLRFANPHSHSLHQHPLGIKRSSSPGASTLSLPTPLFQRIHSTTTTRASLDHQPLLREQPYTLSTRPLVHQPTRYLHKLQPQTLPKHTTQCSTPPPSSHSPRSPAPRRSSLRALVTVPLCECLSRVQCLQLCPPRFSGSLPRLVRFLLGRVEKCRFHGRT